MEHHVPVMPKEVLEYLAPRPGGVYLDMTCGLGGHTGLLARLRPDIRVISLDRDADSLDRARTNCRDVAGRITFRHSRFSQLRETWRDLGEPKLNGILADLGVSLYQLTNAERGFSLMENGPLDMRMDRSQELTAADVVNRASERELSDLIFQLGDERRAGRVSRAILRARPIRDTRHLADVIASAVPRQGKLHPATLAFSALRQAVNDEPAELDSMLEQAPGCLQPGGRWVVIAFHSGEAGKVKTAFRALAREGRIRILTKHVVKPDEEEVRDNPASRSAVLRAAEILGDDGAN
jgi:16S rRNA (cytosine1402-N4)-methyltransferase